MPIIITKSQLREVLKHNDDESFRERPIGDHPAIHALRQLADSDAEQLDAPSVIGSFTSSRIAGKGPVIDVYKKILEHFYPSVKIDPRYIKDSFAILDKNSLLTHEYCELIVNVDDLSKERVANALVEQNERGLVHDFYLALCELKNKNIDEERFIPPLQMHSSPVDLAKQIIKAVKALPNGICKLFCVTDTSQVLIRPA